MTKELAQNLTENLSESGHKKLGAAKSAAKKAKADRLKAEQALEINVVELPDMPVYSLGEGELIGRVKEVIIDPEAKCLLALAVDKGGWYHNIRVIPAPKISTIGDDLIMIDEKQAASVVNLPKIVECMKKPCNIIGAKVISEQGGLLGRIESFYLRREGGKISRLELSGGVFSWLWAGKISLGAEHILTLGAEAVVVDSAAAADFRVASGVLKVNFKAVADWAEQGLDNIGGLQKKTKQRLREIAESKRAASENANANANANAAEAAGV